ncbi:LysE family translocator [Oceanicaulis sp.]|uniref:LysE family translocator n=1 Tax=Oceanicaulis sp. TaxID=1924941 RepID=UPI003BAC29E4
MPDLGTLAAFIVAVSMLMLAPGPNVAVIAATGAVHGRRAALQVVLGATAAQGLQIALVVLGLAALLATYTWAHAVLKWAGVAYLVWLGLKAVLAKSEPLDGAALAPTRLWLRGAATALGNPKTLAFHAAFLPLFVNPAAPGGPQLALLGALYLLIALIVDGGYALLAGALKPVLSRPVWRARVSRTSGFTLLGVAGWLATQRAN